MVTQTEYFITQTKLRELRGQRAKLLAAYDVLSQPVSGGQSEADRLRALYSSLQQITFANYPLHPDVANLEPLLQEAESGQASAETISFWRARLEKELLNGRLRAEIVYIFGTLLEEWALQQSSAQLSETNDEETQRLLAQLTTPPTETSDAAALLDPLFAVLGFTESAAPKYLQEALGDRLQRAVNVSELTEVLEQLSGDPYRSQACRSQASTLLVDKVLLKELADTLTILMQHIDEWDWPRAGVPVQARLTPQKWRLFIDEAFPITCLLEILSQRWQEVFSVLIWKRQRVRLRELRRLPLDANLDGQGNVTAGLGLLGEPNLWAEDSGLSVEAQLSRWVEDSDADYRSVFSQRRWAREQLRKFSGKAGYEHGRAISGLELALMFVNAEIQLARAALPERPVYVIKIDLKDFYPSLPHDLLLTILHRYGLSDAQFSFFRKFLRLPLLHNGQVTQSQRGVPLGPHLSDVLGDLTLRLLEQYVQREARVQIIRMVDDICILAASADEIVKAWQAFQQFCGACGLALNLDKCGSVCIGGERPAALPAAQPNWLFLSLDEQGHWDVNTAALDTYLEQARQQVEQAPSLIARTQTYNAQLRYLVLALGLRIPLDEQHRRSIRQVMQRVHQAFWGEGHGMLDRLRQIIQERYIGQDATIVALPEAWFYWPITAGGVGLTQAPLLGASYETYFTQQWKAEVPEERKSDWQQESYEWKAFYTAFFQEVQPQAPAPNQVMETLVKDFIERGADLSVGVQKELSPYWRWVLYIYGPQVLERLGTFRFLITELVPLQLVGRRYIGETVEDEEAGDRDDIPF